jgi:paired amphipathic helix protein Sin3a
MNGQPPQPPSVLDRDLEREREREEQHMREQHMMRQQQEELAQRNREIEEQERRRREQQYQAVPQHQTNTGAIPIHQPVASRLPGAIHSPGGLLANHGGASQQGPLGAPAGPGNVFGGPLHNDNARTMQQVNQQNAVAQQQHQMFGGANIINHVGHGAPMPGQAAAPFGGPIPNEAAARQIQQLPFGPPVAPGNPVQNGVALAQNQQPILNVSSPQFLYIFISIVRLVGRPA